MMQKGQRRRRGGQSHEIDDMSVSDRRQ